MNISKEELLSVLVPTRERPDTLKHALRTILAQEDPRMEVIVSDNCSAPATRAVVESFSDVRLRYVRPERRLGMSENWEFALSHARGSWVTVIGDDDGLLPGAVARFFDLIEGRDVRVVSSLTCSFVWPDPVTGASGRLICLSGRGAEMRSARAVLRDVLLKGKGYKNMPCLYTGGFMRMDLVREVKERSGGVFYRSKIPDVYSGVVACSMVDQFLFSYAPLAVGGTSQHSTGLQWMVKDTERLEKDCSFMKESETPFYPGLGNGMVQSTPFMVYEGYMQSEVLRDFKIETSLADQLAVCIAFAAQGKEKAVADYCRDVCAANGLPFSVVEDRLRRFRRRAKLRRLLGKAGKVLPSARRVKKEVLTDDPALATIFDAARRAHEVLGLA